MLRTAQRSPVRAGFKLWRQAGCENSGDQLPQIIQRITVSQHLNQQLPLDAPLWTIPARPLSSVTTSASIPRSLALVYYECPLLCSEELNGLASALEMVKLTPGKDFDIVAVVSIDPSERPELAAKKKANYLKRYGHPETAYGWHFLTGQQPASML